MKIFRLVQESPLGDFLIDAWHDGGKVQSLAVYPLVNGIVMPNIAGALHLWESLVKQIETLLELA
jgi:hypothetical protein